MKTKPVPFPVRLRQLRESAGLSQRAVAQAADVTIASYNRWENGHAEPGLSNLRALAEALGVQVSQLTD